VGLSTALLHSQPVQRLESATGFVFGKANSRKLPLDKLVNQTPKELANFHGVISRFFVWNAMGTHTVTACWHQRLCEVKKLQTWAAIRNSMDIQY
jgi:hypothetical protein